MIKVTPDIMISLNGNADETAGNLIFLNDAFLDFPQVYVYMLTYVSCHSIALRSIKK